MKIILFSLFFILLAARSVASDSQHLYIRASQVGYLSEDLKTAVILSFEPLKKYEFKILNHYGTEITKGVISDCSYSYNQFKYCYTIDFSSLKNKGKYLIEVDGNSSFSFEIGDKVFNRVVDSLLLFFQVQRCGPTNPKLHKPCHLSDVSRLIGSGYDNSVDVTGGWHDAGDYIKFLSSTAYTTYLLILAYDIDKKKFGFDNDHNGIPDILEEAKIGLDWLLKANYKKDKLITQVQDLRDHNYKFRLPENDLLQYDRPGFTGISKNQIGIYSAALGLAAKIWKEKFHDYEFSNRCLTVAENFYSLRNNVPDIDTTGTGTYRDVTFWGKLSLGAIELYNVTKKNNYLNDAQTYSDSAGSDYWWSYGNINSLAQYRVAKYNPRFAGYIYNNLYAFNINKNKTVFREGLAHSWGTTNALLGVSLQAILYKELTGSKEFDSLASLQRDYILGRNPWGLSYISNIGSRYPIKFHSQISALNGGYLPGALSAGPAPAEVLKNYNIIRTDNRYEFFNTDEVKYFDDEQDYISNEPTIIGNATAVFVFGLYSSR